MVIVPFTGKRSQQIPYFFIIHLLLYVVGAVGGSRSCYNLYRRYLFTCLHVIRPILPVYVYTILRIALFYY